MEDHTTGCQSQTPLRCREACWGSGATRSTWGPGPQAWVCQPAGMPLGPSPARVWPSRWHGDQRATDDCAAEDVIVGPDEEGKGCKGLVVLGAIPGQRVALDAGAQEFCNTNQSGCMRKCLEEPHALSRSGPKLHPSSPCPRYSLLTNGGPVVGAGVGEAAGRYVRVSGSGRGHAGHTPLATNGANQ